MDFRNAINLNQFELRGAVVQNLSGHGASPKAGQIDYLTSTNVAYIWNGTTWRPLDAAALTDGSIKIAALEVDPRARSTHTGTQTASTISDFGATVVTYRLDQFTAPTSAVSFNGQRQTGVADPINAQDGATKNYVDGAVQSAAAGIDSKPSVRVVATGNLTLSGTQTVDSVSLAAGDRVLAAAQTTASQNGVYVVASGAWTRAADADQTGEVTPGAFWFVEEGTTYGKTQWRCNNAGTVTIGTTAITIVQFGAAALYSASLGVQLVGSDFRAQLNASVPGLVVTAAGLAIDAAVVTRKYVGTITGDGTTTSFQFTHGLGTAACQVTVRDSSGSQTLVDNAVTTTTATVAFGAAPASNVTYTVVVTG